MKKIASALIIILTLSFIVSCGTNTPTSNNTSTVYITKSGTKYHSEGCSSLSKSKIKISLDEVKEKGFEPCEKCNPEK